MKNENSRFCAFAYVILCINKCISTGGNPRIEPRHFYHDFKPSVSRALGMRGAPISERNGLDSMDAGAFMDMLTLDG